MASEPAPRARTLGIALLVSLVLWNVPYGGVLLYPFKLLATWLHEMSHALVMVATGNGLDGVAIYSDTSGVAHAADHAGPLALAIIAPAGYMGTAVWGGALLVATPTPKRARIALTVLAIAMAGTALWVIETPRGDRFGQLAVVAMAAACMAAAWIVPARWRAAIAHFIAAQSCINALLDIRVLVRPTQAIDGMITDARSDAHAMALATFGTSEPWAVYTWAAIWLAWSLLVLFIALRLDQRRTIEPTSSVKKSPAARTTESGA